MGCRSVARVRRERKWRGVGDNKHSTGRHVRRVQKLVDVILSNLLPFNRRGNRSKTEVPVGGGGKISLPFRCSSLLTSYPYNYNKNVSSTDRQ